MNLTAIPKTMSTREIAELTGKSHDNVLRDTRRMLAELDGGVLRIEDTPYTNAQNGQTYREFQLPKRETLILVSGYSVAMRARIIDRWQELETQVAAPAQARVGTSVADAVLIAEHISRTLRLEGAAALDITTRALAIVAPDMRPLLPGYAIDAPRSMDRALLAEGSSRATHPLTDLLKRNGNKVSSHTVRECNLELARLGLLEEKTRRSTASITGTKTYWSVTDAGLAFGKNVTNPKNQRETAPHWYDDTFSTLVALVLDGAAA